MSISIWVKWVWCIRVHFVSIVDTNNQMHTCTNGAAPYNNKIIAMHVQMYYYYYCAKDSQTHSSVSWIEQLNQNGLPIRRNANIKWSLFSPACIICKMLDILCLSVLFCHPQINVIIDYYSISHVVATYLNKLSNYRLARHIPSVFIFQFKNIQWNRILFPTKTYSMMQMRLTSFIFSLVQ